MSISSAYLGVILVWSTTPLAIQWSSGDVSFQFGLASRMMIGLVMVFLIIRVSKTHFVWERRAWPTYLIAGMALYMAMSLVYWASQYIPSGWVSVIFGLTPIISSLANHAFNRALRINPYEVMAAILGFTGLAVIFFERGEVREMAGIGILLMLLSVIVHSVSAVWIKHQGANLDGMTLTAGSLLVSTPLFILNWLIADGAPPLAVPLKDATAIIYLGIMGSAVGFSLYYFLLKHISVRAVALITLITPVIALWLGTQFNGEVVSRGTLVGTVIILSSLLLSQWGSTAKNR